MERADSADTTFGILAISVAECFGSESVSPELASSLKRVLPEATFLRATVRCGSGLFVTDDLLRPGYSMVSLVSLKYSLAGLAMKQGQPLTVRLPAGSSSFGNAAPTRIVACAPISIPSPPGVNYVPLQVGALLVGCSGDLSVNLKAGLSRLAGMAGPALLTIGLSRVQHLSHLLSLRDADAEYIGLEEDLQDLPIEVARPQQSAFGPPTQPLDLGSAVHSEELEAVAAAAAIAAAAVVEDGERKAMNVLYNVDEGVEEAEEEESQPLSAKVNGGGIRFSKGDFKNNADENEENMDETSQFFLGNGTSKSMDSFHNAPIVNGGKKGKQQEESVDGGASEETDVAGFGKMKNSSNGVHLTGAVKAAAVSAPTAVPLNPLLSYQNSPTMESAFIAVEARTYAASDASFCLLYIIALCCSMWASTTSSTTADHGASQPPSWFALILTFTAAMPLMAALSAMMGTRRFARKSDRFYIRCRESLLLLLMLVPVAIARRGGCGGDGGGGGVGNTGPCLTRSADLTMAFFMPLGCRIRFCWLLPAQILNLISIGVGMPWMQLNAAGCGVACAALLGCIGILPLVMTYRCEVKERQRLAVLFNTPGSNTALATAASS